MKKHIGLLVAASAAFVAFAAVPATAAETSTQQSVSSSTGSLQWVRGTAVNFVNASGATIQIGTETDTWDKAPQVNQHDLAAGASEQASQGYSSASGTSVFAKVTYQDGTSVQFSVSNPGIGSPIVKIRDAAYGVLDWQNAPYDSCSFDENQSWTAQLDNGHSIEFHRLGDDSGGHSDSKVWSVTIK